MSGGKGGGQSNSMEQSMGIINAINARRDEEMRQHRIRLGKSAIDANFAGFDAPYYERYANANLDLDMPQVRDQYRDAIKEQTFRHARAGTLASSMSASNTADLAKQNALAQAMTRGKADSAAAALRSRVAQEKGNLTSQLYATTDPEMAASGALNAAKNIGQDQPSYSPLGQMFQVATIGAGNFMNSLRNNAALGSAMQQAGVKNYGRIV